MFCSIKIKRRSILILAVVLLFSFLTVYIVSSKNTVGAQTKEQENKKDGIFVPIIMYHGVLRDESMLGDYVVSPMELEEDFIYLKNNGYTPVFVNDLIRYVNYDGELPKNPVVISFDDGNYNNYTYLYPLLKKYDFKACISLVGEYTVAAGESGDKPNPAYSYLSWKNVSEMRESGLVEFCSHSYAMHKLTPRKGVCRKSGESYENFRSVFIKDIFNLQNLADENCGFKPNVFTYPYGFNDESSRRLVKNCGFEASMGVCEKPNYIIKGSPKCLYNLNRYNRPSGISTEKFMKKALQR